MKRKQWAGFFHVNGWFINFGEKCITQVLWKVKGLNQLF